MAIPVPTFREKIKDLMYNLWKDNFYGEWIMPVLIQQVGDKPVLLATFSGQLKHGDIWSAIQAGIVLVEETGQMVYHISDFRECNATFMDIMQIMKGQQEHREELKAYGQQMQVIFVSVSGHMTMARDVTQSRNQYNIPVFDTVEMALKYVELDSQRQAG